MGFLKLFVEAGRALATRCESAAVPPFVVAAEALGQAELGRCVEDCELTRENLAALHSFVDQCEAAGTMLDPAAVISKLRRAGTRPAAPSAPSVSPSGNAQDSPTYSSPALPWSGLSLPPDLVQTFYEETRERIDRAEQRLLSLEQNPESTDDLDALFRDIHTLKGGAAIAGVGPLNVLAHRAEDLLGFLRSSGRPFTQDFGDLLLTATDRFRAMLQRMEAGQNPEIDVGYLMSELENACKDPTQRPPSVASVSGGGTVVVGGVDTIRVPFSKLDELFGIVGGIVLARSSADLRLNELVDLQRKVDAAFRKLGVSTLGRHLEMRLREAFGEAERQLRQIQLSGVKFDWLRGIDELTRVFNEATRSIPAEMNAVARQLTDLIDATARTEIEGLRALKVDVTKIARANSDLEQRVMKLRMIPVGRLFNKFPRTVRDLSRDLNKRVNLVLEGQETELDKILVEGLDEPLLHLVRNAIDHGLESPDVRAKAGKSETGRLTLRAFGRGDQVIIEVADDGRGIDHVKVMERARTRGLIGADEVLEPRVAYDLLFKPGFSTAEKITDVSGRGVGLDVVRTAIEALKGSIEIESETGRGAVFRVRLPLTLAVVPVLFLRVDRDRVALPLSVVRRSLQASDANVQRVGSAELISFGDQEIPLVRVSRVLGVAEDPTTTTTTTTTTKDGPTFPVLWVETAAGPMGLAFDEILGKGEVIVKSVSGVVRRIPFVTGAAPLGETAVLVLDALSLARVGRNVA